MHIKSEHNEWLLCRHFTRTRWAEGWDAGHTKKKPGGCRAWHQTSVWLLESKRGTAYLWAMGCIPIYNIDSLATSETLTRHVLQPGWEFGTVAYTLFVFIGLLKQYTASFALSVDLRFCLWLCSTFQYKYLSPDKGQELLYWQCKCVQRGSRLFNMNV